MSSLIKLKSVMDFSKTSGSGGSKATGGTANNIGLPHKIEAKNKTKSEDYPRKFLYPKIETISVDDEINGVNYTNLHN